MEGACNAIDHANATLGTLTVRDQRGMPIEVRMPDVRRHLGYLVFCSRTSLILGRQHGGIGVYVHP